MGGGGGQSGCELRSEAFVNGGGVGSEGGGSGWGGGGGGGSGLM